MLGKRFCSDGVESGIEEDGIEAGVKEYKGDSGAGSLAFKPLP